MAQKQDDLLIPDEIRQDMIRRLEADLEICEAEIARLRWLMDNARSDRGKLLGALFDLREGTQQ